LRPTSISVTRTFELPSAHAPPSEGYVVPLEDPPLLVEVALLPLEVAVPPLALPPLAVSPSVWPDGELELEDPQATPAARIPNAATPAHRAHAFDRLPSSFTSRCSCGCAPNDARFA
jgi:hypothetical protein